MSPLPWITPAPPPIKERPVCPGCQTPLKPHTDKQFQHVGARYVSRSWDGTYHGYGAFCTLTCATRTANYWWQAKRVMPLRRTK